jgi:hypothetical protein
MPRPVDFNFNKSHFRDHIIPESSDTIDVGIEGQRWNVGRFKSIIADTIEFLSATFATLTVGTLTVTTKATFPAPIDPTDGVNKAYVDAIGVTQLTVQETDGAPLVNPVNTIAFDQATGLRVVDNTGGIITVDLNAIPVTKLAGSLTDLGTTLTGTVAIADGGTASTTAAGARSAFDVPANAEAILKTIVDAKGDMIVATAADTVARVAIGTDGQVWTADAASTPGAKWATPAAGSVGTSVVDTVTTPVTVANTSSETTVYTKSIVGATIGASGKLQLKLLATIKDTVATVANRTLTLRLKYGATTVATQIIRTAVSYGTNYQALTPTVVVGSVGGPTACVVECDLANLAAADSQYGNAEYRGLHATALVPTVPQNGASDLLLVLGESLSATGTASEDSTAAKTLLVSVQWSAADANCSFIMKEAKLLILP